MKKSSKDVKRDHWLDKADDKFDKQFIEDVKATLRVLVLYIPLPIFWALFDQQVQNPSLGSQQRVNHA